MSFDRRADTWDASDRRQALAEAAARAIKTTFPLRSDMVLLDVGAGTGLLTRRLLPDVGRVVAVDPSAGMLARLDEALSDRKDRVQSVHGDIMAYRCDGCFDGIVSSMTIHHIPDTRRLLEHLHALLKPGGFLAVADLMPEDGTFHDHGNEGVHHFGFEEKALTKLTEEAGFEGVNYRKIFTVDKGEGRNYGIFLLTARRAVRP